MGLGFTSAVGAVAGLALHQVATEALAVVDRAADAQDVFTLNQRSCCAANASSSNQQAAGAIRHQQGFTLPSVSLDCLEGRLALLQLADRERFAHIDVG
ncbi:hypothetical protein D3C77_555560 [compost metagenome]